MEYEEHFELIPELVTHKHLMTDYIDKIVDRRTLVEKTDEQDLRPDSAASGEETDDETPDDNLSPEEKKGCSLLCV